MGERRMLTTKVTDADVFVSMPSSAQALYLHLNMGADDDGFNNQVQLAMFKAHASIDDVKLLLAKRFILQFESGVIVIKHWRMANALRSDRYKPTSFQDEFNLLEIKENKSYTYKDGEWLPNGCQMVAVNKDKLNQIKEINTYCSEIPSEPHKNPPVSEEKPKKKPYEDECKEIIDYLNAKVGTHFRAVSSNNKFISGRLKEGYTTEDCKAVIDKKAAEWMGTDMQQFLRPKTLFNPTNFESYMNAPAKVAKKEHGRVVTPVPDYMQKQIEELDNMTAEKELPFDEYPF